MLSLKSIFVLYTVSQALVFVLGLAIYAHYGATIAGVVSLTLFVLVDIRFALDKIAWRMVDRLKD